MDKVVYVLGAGFSRPLGLPIMSDFVDKGKDMYFTASSPYAHFKKVFDRIRELAIIKNIYKSNLENIEEILSILEMRDLLDNNNQEKSDFENFIIDVINYYTPTFKAPDQKNTDNKYHYVSTHDLIPLDFLFQNDLFNNYGGFVLGLFNKFIYSEKSLLSSNKGPFYRIACRDNNNPEATYSIITLNYDLILENIAYQITSYADTQGGIHFNRLQNQSSNNLPYLVKLHGSVDDKNIIPPTWNKTIGMNKKILSEWTIAYNLLKSANQIRFIGYSLPITDAYVRYLFKAGMLSNDHLKSIDVICLDDENTVVKTYNDFIELPLTKYHFINDDASRYIRFINSSIISNSNIEAGHRSFLLEHHIRSR